MNKWLWLLLAASPMTALAQGDDPIAYKCYYCTPEEKEDVALLQGVGQHYVYDVATLHIVRVEVSLRGGRLVAETFPAEDWVRKQFVGLVQLHGHHLIGSNLEPLGYFERVYLYAPGSDHARSGTYLSSKHFSALHADHGEARRIGARYLEARPVFGFLDMVASGGRLLRLELKTRMATARPLPCLASPAGTLRGSILSMPRAAGSILRPTTARTLCRNRSMILSSMGRQPPSSIVGSTLASGMRSWSARRTPGSQWLEHL